LTSTPGTNVSFKIIQNFLVLPKFIQQCQHKQQSATCATVSGVISLIKPQNTVTIPIRS